MEGGGDEERGETFQMREGEQEVKRRVVVGGWAGEVGTQCWLWNLKCTLHPIAVGQFLSWCTVLIRIFNKHAIILHH